MHYAVAWTLLLWLSIGASFGQGAIPSAESHLLLTQSGRDLYTELAKRSPKALTQIEKMKRNLAELIAQPLQVPLPKDAGGGYTHEQHKANQKAIFEAGVLYKLTGEDKYAEHCKQLLDAYAAMYKSLPLHPEKKEQTPGKLFWQSLNDAVWLVYSVQGFDAIKSYLSPVEREYLKTELFEPYVHFLSVDGEETFNKIHNHGTWALAAVGMTGYSLEEDDWVQMALKGSAADGSGGFLNQLNQLFSPDGYYTEGPYYQRYALMPFVVFAQAIANNNPDLEIFEYRNGILIKAIYAAIDLTYNGHFFPINDALKEKNLTTSEMVFGIDIAYKETGDPRLLSIATYQGSFAPIDAGFETMAALTKSEAIPYDYNSIRFKDGKDGEEGGLAIFRPYSANSKDDAALIYKYTSQGMGHGHFDKLTWLFYDNGNEVIRDYGAARFLNIEAKYGGHYLKENNTWAKQSIAHTTVVVDEKSHFEGKYKVASAAYPTEILYDVSEPNLQVASAELAEVYPGVKFIRTMALVQDEAFEYPLVLDLFEVESEEAHQYDLPLYFNGQFIHLNSPIQAHQNQLKPLGNAEGYEHLWNLGEAQANAELTQFTWLLNDRFYTWSSQTDTDDKLILVELGAHDPDFSLRNERGLVLRTQSEGKHYFLSALETHGTFDAKNEVTVNASNQILELKLITRGAEKIIQVMTKDSGIREFKIN